MLLETASPELAVKARTQRQAKPLGKIGALCAAVIR
jgi:hypothetical protein